MPSVINTPNNAPAPTPPITRTTRPRALTHFSLHRGNGSGAHARIQPRSYVMCCASVPSSVGAAAQEPAAGVELDDQPARASTARVRRAMSCAWSR